MEGAGILEMLHNPITLTDTCIDIRRDMYNNIQISNLLSKPIVVFKLYTKLWSLFGLDILSIIETSAYDLHRFEMSRIAILLFGKKLSVLSGLRLSPSL